MKKILNLMIAVCCVISGSFIFSGCGATKCNHTSSKEWFMNSTHHWHECTDCGEKLDKEEHDWEEIIIETIPTENDVALYVCKGCGMGRFAVCTVSEQEWNNALDLSCVNNYKAYVKTELLDGTIVVDGSIVKSGDVVCQESLPDGANGYYSKEGDKYYYYQKASGSWNKTEITQYEYEGRAGKNFSSFDYSAFAYNDESKAYEANLSGLLYQIYFENGRLVKIVHIDGEAVQTLTIKYVETELVLPTVG